MPLHFPDEKWQPWHGEAAAASVRLNREAAAAAIANGEEIEYMHKGQWFEIKPFSDTIAVLQFAPAFRRKQKE